MLLGIQNIILLVQLVKEHDGKWRYPSASQAKPSIVVSNDSVGWCQSYKVSFPQLSNKCHRYLNFTF